MPQYGNPFISSNHVSSQPTPPQPLINHVVLLVDESGSMDHHKTAVVDAVEATVKRLAVRSQEMNQETRITVYAFSDYVRCLFYDIDVLRLPSIRQWYKPSYMTAMIDATMVGIQELKETPQRYGDHAFLFFLYTDGIENASKTRASTLNQAITTLPENWTIGAFVPNQQGVRNAALCGIPSESIATWDTASAHGFTEAASIMHAATERFMQGRAQGVRGTKNLFSTDAETVNAKTIQAADLKPLKDGSYLLIPVPDKAQIRPFVLACGHPYKTGSAFYQLSKTETIQANKKIAVVDKKTAKVYTGPEARSLVGLQNTEVRVKPDFNPDYDIYVQSTSVNRNLMPGTRLLLTGL